MSTKFNDWDIIEPIGPQADEVTEKRKKTGTRNASEVDWPVALFSFGISLSLVGLVSMLLGMAGIIKFFGFLVLGLMLVISLGLAFLLYRSSLLKPSKKRATPSKEKKTVAQDDAPSEFDYFN